MKTNSKLTFASLIFCLSGCSQTAQAPATSNLSAQDLNALTSVYQLVQFDLATCGQLPASVPAETVNISTKICADATNYQTKLQAVALSRGVTLPNVLRYDLKARIISMTYHASPNENVEYLRDEIDSHQEALAIFEDEAMHGTDPEIQSFDKSAIPLVQANLDALRKALAATT